ITIHSLCSNWPGARREGGSVSPAILDRLSNEAPGQFQRNPEGGLSFGRRRCCSLLTDPLRDMLWCPCGSTSRLVWCLAIGWCFDARNFRFPRGASDEHTLQRSVRSEQRSGRRKGLRPGGLRRKRPGASLLLGHRALRLCSLVAPCPRPFWAQRNTSQLRDTTLAFQRWVGCQKVASPEGT